jgi:hypothetical protein
MLFARSAVFNTLYKPSSENQIVRYAIWEDFGNDISVSMNEIMYSMFRINLRIYIYRVKIQSMFYKQKVILCDKRC